MGANTSVGTLVDDERISGSDEPYPVPPRPPLGMRQPWPEGAFYGFDVIYGRDLLADDGLEFGWWGNPDQFAPARLDWSAEPYRGKRGKNAGVLAMYSA